jgi:hypothetical protein
MRLRKHPGFLDGWPARAGGPFDRSYAAPADGSDILVDVFLQRPESSDETSVALRTIYRGGEYTRDFRVADQEFAEALVRFLTLNAGRMMKEIGELEVDF